MACTLLLVGVLFLAYARHERQRNVERLVDKARTITITAESVREGMERKWSQGVFTPQMLRAWGEAGEMGKVLEAVPVVTAWRARKK